MNRTRRWVERLTAAGIEAMQWSNVGGAKASDAEIMAYARAQEFCVLTHDLDFGTILALTNWDKPSVVQIRIDDASPQANAKSVIAALFAAQSRTAAWRTFDNRTIKRTIKAAGARPAVPGCLTERRAAPSCKLSA